MLEKVVKMWEEKVIIPTYGVGCPDKNPCFWKNVFIRGVRERYTHIL